MNKDHICGFLLGLSVGASVALLCAPRSGKKTRAQIAQAANQGATYVKERGEIVGEATRALVERGKDAIDKAMKEGAAAYQAVVR